MVTCSVEPVRARSAAHVELLVTASADPSVTEATYLPHGMTSAEAGQWASDHEHRAWVVCCDGVPVGVCSVSSCRDTCGVAVSPLGQETESWLLPAFRHRRLVSQAWQQIYPVVTARDVPQLVAVIWESNVSSIRRVERDGYRHVGRGWWSDGICGGWCVVLVLDLPTRRDAIVT